MSLDAVAQPPPDTSSSVLVREVAAVPAQAGLLRDMLTGWARERGLPDELTADLTLAGYEAMANVVEHAYHDGEDGTMTLVASRQPDRVTLIVADTGHWRDSDSRPYGGRGLRLIRALAPETALTTSPAGTTLRMCWPQPPTSPPALFS